MNQADSTTKTANPFSPVLKFRLPAKSTHQRVRVRAVGTMAGWYFIIADYESRAVIHRDIGELPKGFTFNQATAELYSLAQAARWLAAQAPGAIVAMLNTAQPSPNRSERKAVA